MRNYVLLSSLLVLALMPALAQDTISANSQTIQGTWITQIPDTTGNLALFEVGTFHPDGSYSSANVTPSHSAHTGVWLRTGDRKFVLTILFFTHDDKDVFNGIVKVRILLTLAEDLKSYDSVAERTVMDASGKVLQVIPGIAGHAVRMDVEFPMNTPAQ
jgi:hypothetical protein